MTARNPRGCGQPVTVIKELESLLPPGSAFGQSECGATPPLPAGISTFEDTCNHLHIQIPKGTR
jgi:hypothetical protein